MFPIIKSRVIASLSFDFESVVQSIVTICFRECYIKKKYCAFDAENPDNLKEGGGLRAPAEQSWDKYNLFIYYILRAEMLIIF